MRIARVISSALLVVVLVGGAAAARAQAPDEAAPDELGDAPAAPTSPAVDTETPTPPAARAVDGMPFPTDEAQALDALRALEARLSVGEPLAAAEEGLLFALVARGPTARVRAHATGVAAWLPAEQAGGALIAALSDGDAMVRAQAATGLAAFANKLDEENQRRAAVRLTALLDDPSDEVGCAAARTLAALDAARGKSEIMARANDASDLRHGCFADVAGLAPRPIAVARPSVARAPSPAAPEGEAGAAPLVVDGPDPLGGLGSGLFIATAATVGMVAGGLIVPTLVPPRDTLTYSRRVTRHGREEPSILLTVGAGLVGGAALGAGAWGLTALTDGVGFAPASTTTLMTVAGGAAGFGLGLTLNLDEPWAGASIIASTVSGLVVGAAMSLVMPPTTNDVTLVSATGGAFTMFGTLLAYTIIPVGNPTVLFGAKRNDFAVGTGLLSGALGTTLALAATPVVDFSHGRVLAASGAALAMTMTGIAVAYLVQPVDFVYRPRIAAGVGTALGVTAGLIVLAALPSSWATMLERVDAEVGQEAIVIDQGDVRLGLPAFWIRPEDATTGQASTEVGVALIGGRF